MLGLELQQSDANPTYMLSNVIRSQRFWYSDIITFALCYAPRLTLNPITRSSSLPLLRALIGYSNELSTALALFVSTQQVIIESQCQSVFPSHNSQPTTWLLFFCVPMQRLSLPSDAVFPFFILPSVPFTHLKQCVSSQLVFIVTSSRLSARANINKSFKKINQSILRSGKIKLRIKNGSWDFWIHVFLPEMEGEISVCGSNGNASYYWFMGSRGCVRPPALPDCFQSLWNNVIIVS